MNSTFRARRLASSEVISQMLFTSEQPMASRFASVSEEEILSMNEEAVPKNTKMATKFGVIVLILMVSYLISLTSALQPWFHQEEEFNQPFRKWYRINLTSACKSFICRQEGETELFTIKTRLLLFGQPLIDIWEVHRWISLFSIIGEPLFTEANKTLSN